MTAPRPAQPAGPVPPPATGGTGGRPRWDVVAVVALGGALGSLARYGISVGWPHPHHGFPWSTLVVNLAGCALIGVLMQLISTRIAPHRLVRPFFGTGVLGGFTTFSTYTVEIRDLLGAGRTGVALGYLFGTVAGALLAVQLGAWAAERFRPS